MKPHTKHAKITRLNIGDFHQNEFAILGTPCGNIKQLSYAIISHLAGKLNVGYVDADHKNADGETIGAHTALSYGSGLEYIDKINFHRFDVNHTLNKFDFRQKFSSQDLVLVNGNHFKAKNQIVVIDSKKSLEKKLDKLSNVVLVLFQEGESIIPQYLRNHVENINDLPKYKIGDKNAIASFINDRLNQCGAPLNGLVLAGGKSTRMRRDKGKIVYHGIEQRLHMYGLLSKLTSRSFVSIRSDQKEGFSEEINTIEDVYFGLGPYGAILSAFQKEPNTAWMVAACDQPLLNKETLKFLIENRNTSKVATAFHNSETGFPEPLITIWEPRAYSRLLYFLSLGYSCPRKVLINSDIALIKLENEKALKNANTPEEFHQLLAELK